MELLTYLISLERILMKVSQFPSLKYNLKWLLPGSKFWQGVQLPCRQLDPKMGISTFYANRLPIGMSKEQNYCSGFWATKIMRKDVKQPYHTYVYTVPLAFFFPSPSIVNSNSILGRYRMNCSWGRARGCPTQLTGQFNVIQIIQLPNPSQVSAQASVPKDYPSTQSHSSFLCINSWLLPFSVCFMGNALFMPTSIFIILKQLYFQFFDCNRFAKYWLNGLRVMEQVVNQQYILISRQISRMSGTVLTEQFIQKAIANPLQNQTCAQLHPGVSCNLKMAYQFALTCRSLYKTYLLVHLIPFIIFKRKKIMHRPWKEVKNLVKGFLKSMMFVGFYMVIVRRTICEFTRFYKFTSLSAAAGAILGGLALIFETKSRQAEIALYCVNKSIETAYSLLRRRNYPVGLPYGECILLGVATAIICYLYSDCHKAFESKYTKVLDRLIGTI